MAGRGVHFALNAEDTERLLAAAGNDTAVKEIIQEDIEERWDKEWLAQSDKAWDAIHRCLGGGSLTFETSGPGHQCILGGRQLHQGDDYIVSFLTPAQVQAVAAKVASFDESAMREAYNAIPESDYGQPLSEEDFQYTWSWFQGVRDLYQKAALAGRAMIFTVDQ
jgi:hypothetical protein